MQKVISKEYSSPIKQLQSELSNPNTPRHYSHTQRTQGNSTPVAKNSYQTQIANRTERAHRPYDTIIEEAPQNNQIIGNQAGFAERSPAVLTAKQALTSHKIE